MMPSKKRIIHLIPTAGLGNRLRVISSVYNYCLNNDLKLIVHWHRQYGLNASFKSLFKPIPNMEVVDCVFSDFFNYNVPSWYNLYMPQFIDKFLNRNVRYGLGLNELDKLSVQSNLTISTYSQQGDLYSLVDMFQPVEDIQIIIERFSKQFGKNTVGCHIRRTDNCTSIKVSSLDKFERKMDNLFATSADAKIFLCTDDNEVKRYFVDKYENKVITYNSTLERNSFQGIRDALIELWLLSLTNEIWGSYWSSFTDMAVSIRNTSFSIVK